MITILCICKNKYHVDRGLFLKCPYCGWIWVMHPLDSKPFNMDKIAILGIPD